MRSHPMWVRGLKLLMVVTSLLALNVAPYVGAWIETFSVLALRQAEAVAPYVGAWIETSAIRPFWILFLSHPMWVRGLKQKLTASNETYT